MSDRPNRPAGVTSHAVAEHMESGAPLEVAAALAGVDMETVEEWIGNVDDEACVAFATSIAKAAARAELEAIKMIRSGEKGWQGSLAWLERTAPERWAKESKQLREQLNKRAAAVTTEDEAKAKPAPDEEPEPRRLWTPKVVEGSG